METVTFVIENKKDLNLLITIAEKLGISKFFTSQQTKEKNLEFEEIYKIIDAGADVSSYGNPSVWQRETRKDRKL